MRGREIMKLTNLLERLSYRRAEPCGPGEDFDPEITSVVFDSRKAVPGCLFVCIIGMTSDGHTYIPEVAAAGAAAILAVKGHLPKELPKGPVYIEVENTRLALALVSAAWFGYPAEHLPVIGITGTKGKTTTTYMVKSILDEAGIETGLIGTIEIIIKGEHIHATHTTPESWFVQSYLARMVEAGCKCCVMEVSSQALMLDRTAGIPFAIGVFTNLGEDHIGPGEHRDFEDYLHCKSLLFRQCRIGIVNLDDPYADRILEGSTCRAESFGVDRKDADLTAENIDHVHEPGYLGVHFTAVGRKKVEADCAAAPAGASENGEKAALAFGSAANADSEGGGLKEKAAAPAGASENDQNAAPAGGSENGASEALTGGAENGAEDSGEAFCLPVTLPIPGKFSVYNALTAIAICRHFGVPAEVIQKALASARVKGRVEMVKVSDHFTLLIDYAHNAMALESLLETLRDYHPHRLVTVFGCGGNRARSRRFEMGEVSGKMADFTVITSDNPRFEEPEAIMADIVTGMKKTEGRFITIVDRKEAIAWAMAHGEPGDIIVLAGKGHEDYQEIRGVRYPMDERVLIREILEEAADGRG